MAKTEHSPEIKRLFDEVYANPDDDAARLVLSDALIEIDDPRGHFIALQFGKSVGKVDPRKEQKLLRQFGEEWCSPIGRACFQHTFERGFIGRATTRDDLIKDEMIGHRAWSTIRLLTITERMRGYNERRNAGDYEQQIRLLLSSEPIRMWTRTIEGMPPDVTEDVFGATQVRRWRDVTCRSDRAERLMEAIRSMTTANMPELRRLDITLSERTQVNPVLSRRLLSAPIVPSLEILGVTTEASDSVVAMLGVLAEEEDPKDWPGRLIVTCPAGMITIDLRGDRAGAVSVGLVRSGQVLGSALTGLAPIKSALKSVTIVRAREDGWNAPNLSELEWRKLEQSAARIAPSVKTESIP
jgi:uncharacterized protein (TIGR02996 family)